MKTNRFLCSILTFTLIGTGYVHLQIQSVKVGYMIQKSEQKLADLFDEERLIQYSIAKLKAPQILTCRLSDSKMYFCDKSRVVAEYKLLAENEIESEDAVTVNRKRENKLLGFLFATPTAEAQSLERNK